MAKLLALLDSNVVIASIAEDHEHHEPSNALFQSVPAQSLAIAAHSYAEAYSVLTRKASPFGRPPADVIAALESVAALCALVGLTHAQTFDAIREFAGGCGIGPRLYDKLIGQAAVANRIGVIVTWNSRHMTSLFPELKIVTPVAFLKV